MEMVSVDIHEADYPEVKKSDNDYIDTTVLIIVLTLFWLFVIDIIMDLFLS